MYLVKRWTVSSIFRTYLITILEALITTSQQVIKLNGVKNQLYLTTGSVTNLLFNHL